MPWLGLHHRCCPLCESVTLGFTHAPSLAEELLWLGLAPLGVMMWLSCPQGTPFFDFYLFVSLL